MAQLFSFDHRFKSNLASVMDHGLELDTASHMSSSLESPGSFDWTSLHKISEIIFNSSFRVNYGKATCFAISSDYIVFGTTKAHVIVFDFKQNIKTVLGTKDKLYGSVTSICLSSDSTYVAVGHELGYVHLWDIQLAKSPVLSFTPVTTNDKLNGKEGHLHKPICHIFFVNKRHTAIVSADIDGLVLFHNALNTLFGFSKRVSKILGSSNFQFSHKISNAAAGQSIADFFNKKLNSYVFGCAPLPLPKLPTLSDNLGLFAVITSSALLVISVFPKIRTHLKLGRPKALESQNAHYNGTACLSWFPQTQKLGPRLAYSFGNVLTILELEIVESEHDDPEKVLDSLAAEVVSKKRCFCEESLVSIRWLNDKVLLAMTNSCKVLIIDTGLVKFRLNNGKLRQIDSVDLISQHVTYNNLVKKVTPIPESENAFSETSYESSLSKFNAFEHTLVTYRENVFILTDTQNVKVGQLIYWEKHLSRLISEAKLATVGAMSVESLRIALDDCLSFYQGDCDLVRFGLPADDSERHNLVQKHLYNLVHSNLAMWSKHGGSLHTQDQTNQLIRTVLTACVAMESSPEEIEVIFEYFESRNETMFFDTLQWFIYNKQITELTPKLFKLLVLKFVENPENDLSFLEQLICLLNVQAMDVDLVFSLCAKYNLTDSRIYICNVLFKDYISPLFEFLTMIRKFNYQLADTASSAASVYTYLTYIFTGRQYPLDTFISQDTDIFAVKSKLYYILFNGSSVEWPQGSGEFFFVSDNPINEPAFPYLFSLLKFDLEKTLLMLNEIFEDNFLNESQQIENLEINRQYIIEIAIQVFQENEKDFDLEQEIFLSIFIMRNYPKYPQFITLNDNTLDNLIETICELNSLKGDLSEEKYNALKNDCELSLQSLLSIYHPANLNDELVHYFLRNGFSNLLFSVYKSEKKAANLFELWLLKNQELKDSYNSNEILELCYDYVNKTFGNEFGTLHGYIVKNFEFVLAHGDIQELCEILIKNDKDLIKEIHNVGDVNLKYQFLQHLFGTGQIAESAVAEIEDILLYIKITSQLQGSSISIVKRLCKKSFSKQTTSRILETLRDNGDTESMIYIYENIEKDYNGALNVIIDFLQKFEGFDDGNEAEKQIWKYVLIAITQCKEASKERDPEESMQLWIKLNGCLCNLIHKHEIFKRVLQGVFVSLIDTNFSKDDERNSGVLLKIFNELLDSFKTQDGAKIATVGEIKDIVEEMFFLNLYQQESLKITLNVFNKAATRNVDNLQQEKLRGVTMNSVDCTKCGKRIWGRKISNKVFQNWEEFQRAKTKFLIDNHKNGNSSSWVKELKFEDETWKDLNVVIFNCGHGYHEKCVRSGTEIKCVICRE